MSDGWDEIPLAGKISFSDRVCMLANSLIVYRFLKCNKARIELDIE